MKEFTRRGFIYAAATLGGYGMLMGVQRVCSSAFEDGVEPTKGAGPVKIIKFADDGISLGASTATKVQKTTAQWKSQLTPLQFDVTRRAATEWAFTGALDSEHRTGLYRCIDCDNALFDSQSKFDSGTGWPSFFQPIARENARETKRFLARGSPHRGEVHPLRLPSGPRFYRWAAAYRPPLLYEFRRAAIPPSQRLGPSTRWAFPAFANTSSQLCVLNSLKLGIV